MSTTVQGPTAVLGFEPPKGCRGVAIVTLFAESEEVYADWRDRLAEAGHTPEERVWFLPDSGKQCKALQWSEGRVLCSIQGPREPRA